MKRFFLIFISFILLINLFVTKTAAEEDSVISHDITYQVLESGLTRVTMNTGITNKESGSYTASYSIDLGFEDLTNVKASDNTGAIDPIVSDSENGKKVELSFNDKVVGINNTLRFKLSFDTNKIARKQGNIWEVSIPGLAKQSTFSQFNVHVRVPPSFGEASFIKPEKPLNNLNFTKEDLGDSGIFITFGNSQIYNFNLNYHIKNSNLFPVKTEIALPPTTNYQDIFISIIDPRPENVIKDKDGNWLAEYFLMPSEKKDINVKGKAKIHLNPKIQEMTEEELAEFLKEKPYWQVSNGRIKQLAKELKTPKAIYEYVVKTLSYDFSRLTNNLPRVGAVQVLDKPASAVCMEYTDLFIAIARAAGIPAREVDGFANTENSKQRPLSLVKDILHAWPEYYDRDRKAWIMIDPTWGSTTKGTDYFDVLDFDHFAFIIKGLDSEYPVPAGGYKIKGGENNKDVDVTAGGTYEEAFPSIEMKIDIADKVYSGFPINGNVILSNNGGVSFPSQILTINTDAFLPRTRKVSLEEVPPFGHLKLPVNFEKMPLFSSTRSSLEFKIGDKSILKTIEVSPFFFKDLRIIGGVLGAIFTIAIFIAAARTWGLFVPRRKE